MASIIARTIALARRGAVRAGLVRFRRNQSGATAVEFALVATPFFALMFAIIETALLFFADQTLDTAVSTAARLIRTGEAQQQGLGSADFKTSICNQMPGLLDCTKLKLDVRKYATFGDIVLGVPLDNNKNLVNNFTYQPGAAGDIVVVRFMYPWPIYASLFGAGLANMSGNQRLLVATAAFRNEPF